MENTNYGPGQKGKMGIVQFILSRKEGQQFLAACLFSIIALCGVIVYQARRIDKLHDQNYEIKANDADREIEYWKQKNDNELKLKNQVDSMKAALIIYKLKKQMK